MFSILNDFIFNPDTLEISSTLPFSDHQIKQLNRIQFSKSKYFADAPIKTKGRSIENLCKTVDELVRKQYNVYLADCDELANNNKQMLHKYELEKIAHDREIGKQKWLLLFMFVTLFIVLFVSEYTRDTVESTQQSTSPVMIVLGNIPFFGGLIVFSILLNCSHTRDPERPTEPILQSIEIPPEFQYISNLRQGYCNVCEEPKEIHFIFACDHQLCKTCTDHMFKCMRPIKQSYHCPVDDCEAFWFLNRDTIQTLSIHHKTAIQLQLIQLAKIAPDTRHCISHGCDGIYPSNESIVNEFRIFVDAHIAKSLNHQSRNDIDRSKHAFRILCEYCKRLCCRGYKTLLSENEVLDYLIKDATMLFGKTLHVYCAKCKRSFCRRCYRDYVIEQDGVTHSHEDHSCDDFERVVFGVDSVTSGSLTDALVVNKSELLVRMFTRPCPNCNVDTNLADGCNHVTCSKCKYEYCWQCRKDWVRWHEC